MKLQLAFAKHSTRQDISGALPFRFEPTELRRPARFRQEQVKLSTAAALCRELDRLAYGHPSAIAFLQDREASLGSRRYIAKEFTRALEARGSTNLDGCLLALPFKCPVPAKTGHHTTPDLGELMFLHRLGAICEAISTNTRFKLRITVLEETQALSPVFQVEERECRAFQSQLGEYIEVLGVGEYVRIEPLHTYLAASFPEYCARLDEQAGEIGDDMERYSGRIREILPTIALSLNTNQLAAAESRSFIAELFARPVSETTHRQLFETAFRYAAFLKLQREGAFRDKYFNDFIQFSLSPKPGRVGLRPTLATVKRWAHHGVPVVRVKKGGRDFQIEYFSDFLAMTRGDHVTEVSDQQGRFLYYLVEGEETRRLELPAE